MRFNTKNTIIAIVIFLACAGIGFGTTYMLKRCDNQKANEETSDQTSDGDPIYDETKPEKKDTAEDKKRPVPPLEKDTTFFKDQTHKKVVRGSVINITYRVRYVGKVRNNELINVRAKDSVEVKGDYPDKKEEKKKDEEKPKPASVPKMTYAEMRQMLKSGSMAGNDKLAPDFQIIVTGQKSGEKRVESPMDVHDKIKFGQWQDVSVARMTFADDGCVSMVNIKPVY